MSFASPTIHRYFLKIRSIPLSPGGIWHMDGKCVLYSCITYECHCRTWPRTSTGSARRGAAAPPMTACRAAGSWSRDVQKFQWASVWYLWREPYIFIMNDDITSLCWANKTRIMITVWLVLVKSDVLFLIWKAGLLFHNILNLWLCAQLAHSGVSVLVWSIVFINCISYRLMRNETY